MSAQQPAVANLSVHEFFGQINWHGMPTMSDDLGDLLEADTTYATVGQFLGTFPWRGSGSVTTQPTDSKETMELPAIDDDTLTLEDLSALF